MTVQTYRLSDLDEHKSKTCCLYYLCITFLFILLANLALHRSIFVCIQATGQEIPAIVISCIRIINLYGKVIKIFLSLGLFACIIQSADMIVMR